MNAVTHSSGKLFNLFLLIITIEIKFPHIHSGVNLFSSQLHQFVAASDGLPHGFFGLKVIMLLINISDLHCFANSKCSFIWFLLPSNHFKQRSLTRAVWPNNSNNTCGG